MVFAAPLSAKVRRCGGGLLVTLAGSPSQSKPVGFARFPLLSLTRHLPPARGKSFLKVGALGSPRRLHLFAKASPFDRLPRPGEAARSARRGIRWICEAKTERARLLPLCDVPFSLSTPAICAITTTFREKVSSPRWRKPKAGAGESCF